MKKIILFIFILGILFGQSIDTDKSSVNFTVRNMGVRDVSGIITDMQGTVKFDEQKLDSSYFYVSVNVNTIDTENEKRDEHLKNEDFFETDKWPTISFQSTSIENQDSVFIVNGLLTMKDVTKEILVPFSVTETDTTIIFTGSDVVNRLDYNIGTDYNNFKIGYEVTVEVNCVLNID